MTLFKHFSRFGTVLSHHVFSDEKGSSVGYAIVGYLTKEEALDAIKNNNGIRFYGQKIGVSKFSGDIEVNSVAISNIFLKLFIPGHQNSSYR